jgi:hypothetical protein
MRAVSTTGEFEHITPERIHLADSRMKELPQARALALPKTSC